ncbi:MAG: AEC family transporter [Bacteriovorax sp.]|nr:AEC family transporter [Bacteriovorax sp.]
MTNFIVIFTCMIAGILFKKIRQFPANTPQALNAFIIYLSLPALVFTQLPKLLVTLDWNSNWWLPVSMAWICFIFSYIIISFIGKKLGWGNAKIGALILTAGLGNTSFVGFPLLEAIVGPQAIPIGILVDQPGSFLVLSTFGVIVAAMFSGAKITPKFVARRVFTFPPFLCLFATAVWYTGWGRINPHSLDIIMPAFEKVASTLVPLALFSVGFQLQFDLAIFKKRWVGLTIGLALKLILFPAFFAFFYIKVLGGHDLVTHVIILESAMATMITAAVVAGEFHLDSEIANLMVGVGIPLSLITVPLWNYILGY